ncbi:MAG: helix-turn-helix transcriptional regulator [Eubacterium sp.]|nr:helix-turn-helix transcriptional regulator [Eubacterium sp.]
MVEYPVIDLHSTGARINELRRERGITVDELRIYLGMNNPNSIYKWFRGEVLPTLENMYALSVILEVPIDDIIGRTA